MKHIKMERNMKEMYLTIKEMVKENSITQMEEYYFINYLNQVYDGNWENDAMNGQGTLYYADGKPAYDVIDSLII